MKIRNAEPFDAPFLAKCVMAGMHLFDFEEETPDNGELYNRLTECERRDDLLYTYKNSRVAEVDGVVVGSWLTFSPIWKITTSGSALVTEGASMELISLA